MNSDVDGHFVKIRLPQSLMRDVLRAIKAINVERQRVFCERAIEAYSFLLDRLGHDSGLLRIEREEVGKYEIAISSVLLNASSPCTENFVQRVSKDTESILTKLENGVTFKDRAPITRAAVVREAFSVSACIFPMVVDGASVRIICGTDETEDIADALRQIAKGIKATANTKLKLRVAEGGEIVPSDGEVPIEALLSPDTFLSGAEYEVLEEFEESALAAR